MTYAECIKNIQAKLPDGWRACLHPSPTIRRDNLDMEWWYGITDTSGYSSTHGYCPTLAYAYDAMMKQLDPKPCDLHTAAVEEVNNA